MHILPRSELYDKLMLYGFAAPVVAAAVIIVIMSIISVAMWAFGTSFLVPG